MSPCNMIIIRREVRFGSDRHVKIKLNIVAAAISLAMDHVRLWDNKCVKPNPAFIFGTKNNAVTVNESRMLQYRQSTCYWLGPCKGIHKPETADT